MFCASTFHCGVFPFESMIQPGLRESDNPVEREGVRRAWESIAQADVVIYLVDASKGFSDADQRIIEQLGDADCRSSTTRVIC